MGVSCYLIRFLSAMGHKLLRELPEFRRLLRGYRAVGRHVDVGLGDEALLVAQIQRAQQPLAAHAGGGGGGCGQATVRGGDDVSAEVLEALHLGTGAAAEW